MYLDMACTWTQSYLSRPIAPTTFFRRFSGWSNFTGAYITLPYYPVLEMVSVVEYWGLNGPQVLQIQTPENQAPGPQVYQVDWLQGYLIRTFSGLIQRPWFPGSNNIEVTWVAGYDPIPPDIKIATLELIAYWWRSTQQASRSRAVGAAGSAGFGSDEHNPLWPGIPNRVTTLLETYLQFGVG
jgi:hypothetical protein